MHKFNNWSVPYSVITFFERSLSGHNKVVSVERTRDILFKIHDNRGRILQVLLLNEYCLGLAAVLRALDEFPEAEFIVTGGNWNGYTREAKEYGLTNNIGIFNLGEFMGALNYQNPKAYCKRDKDGNPIYPFKSA